MPQSPVISNFHFPNVADQKQMTDMPDQSEVLL